MAHRRCGPECLACAARDVLDQIIRAEMARGDLCWWMLSFYVAATWRMSIVVRAFGKMDATRESAWRGVSADVDPRILTEIKFTRLREDVPRALVNRMIDGDLDRDRALEFAVR